MTEDDACEHLLAEVRSIQCQMRELEGKSSLMQTELKTLWEIQKELRSELRMKSSDGANGAYERLLKKEHETRQYLDMEFPEIKSNLEAERLQLVSRIEALRNDIDERSKMLDVKLLPTKEEMELMKED